MTGSDITRAPSTRARWLVALVIGAVSAAIPVLRLLKFPDHQPDFVQVWFGARAMLNGVDPYSAIGPGLEFDWPWKLYYPATAMVAAIPFAPLSSTIAFSLFTAVSAALLAYAVTENDWQRLWIFFSVPFFVSAMAAQWSPVLTAAMLMPPLAILWAAKPNVGAAMFLATSSTRTLAWAVGGGLALLAISLMFDPTWPAAWLQTLGENIQRAPITRLGGPLILLALLRWRRLEARLIVALACVPQTAYWYEAVPLLLVPQTRKEIHAFVLVMALGVLVERAVLSPAPEAELHRRLGAIMVAFAYLPAVVLVLRRPNEGPLSPVHRAVERVVLAARRPFAR